MAPRKNTHVSLRLTPKQRARLDALARVNELTASGVLTTLLERAPLDLSPPILEGLRQPSTTTESRAEYAVSNG